MKREFIRQGIHLVYGALFSFLCAYDAWIGVGVSVVFVAGAIAHRHRDLPLIGNLIARLERPDDPLPLFGSITLTIGITSVALVFPEHGLIAGLGVAIIDSIATAIGLLGGSSKKLGASIVGGAVFFVVTTSAFSEVRTMHLAFATIAGIAAEYLTHRNMLIDDNIAVAWAIAITLAAL